MPEVFTDYIPYALWALDWTIRIVLGVRVVLRRSSVGFTLAWLAVILLLPLLGAVIYLLLGERRLGARRARRIEEMRKPYGAWLDGLARDFPTDESDLPPAARSLRRQARGLSGIPALPGNKVELIRNSGEFFEHILEDIRQARSSIHLEFYIWMPGDRVDGVVDALTEAVERGVKCRVLVDAVGGMDFWSHESHARMEDAGITVLPMLKVGVVRSFFERLDLRNHRKIAVFDGKVGYTGSQNMADPRVFKKQAGVGEWVDAMLRVTGPAVEALQVTFLADYEFEAHQGIEKRADEFDLRRGEMSGESIVQVVPSGPGLWQSTIQDLILTAMYGAQHELVMTTPYFIPDEAMVKAIVAAAARGVDVTLVVPARPDGRIVKLANEAYFEQMLEAGVRIMRFREGLLHTKAISIDNEVAMFGTVNLDMRSFYLNYEISLLLYDRDSTGAVHELQDRYIEMSEPLDYEVWRARPLLLRFFQHAAQLLSPLL